MARARPATAEEVTAAVTGLDDPYVVQVSNLVAEARLTDEEVHKVAGTYEDLEDQAVYALIASLAMEYEGFSPIRTIKSMLALHSRVANQIANRPASLVTRTVRFMHGEEEKEFTVTNNDQFKTDVRNILTLFLTRGASISKIKEKSRQGIKEALEILVLKYGINTTKRQAGSALGGDIITVPRIAAAFPIQTVNLLSRGVGRILIKKADAFVGDVPLAFFSPMVTALIPRTLPNCHAQQLLLAVMVDDVLHSQGKRTSITSIWTYYQASFNSDYISEEVRLKVFKGWELLTPDERNFAASITSQKGGSLAKIRELRPGVETEEVLAKIEAMR